MTDDNTLIIVSGEERVARPVTYGQKYGPLMTITNQHEAERYFYACVEHQRLLSGCSWAEAEEGERSNIGYFAGYYNEETRRRVQELFRCAHPIFGPMP